MLVLACPCQENEFVISKFQKSSLSKKKKKKKIVLKSATKNLSCTEAGTSSKRPHVYFD